MTGYVIQFIAMASFGLSNCLWAYPLKKMPPLLLIAIRATLTSLLFLLLILSQSLFGFSILKQFYLPLSALRFEDVLLSVFICAVSYFGLFFFNLSIKHGSVSLSIPILCIGTLFGIITGVFFYWESFTFFKGLAGFIFIIGLWCMEKLNPQMWRLQFSKGVYYSLLAMLFWGASAFYLVSIKRVGALNFSFVLESTVAIMSWLGFLFQKKNSFSFYASVTKENFHWIIKLALCGFCGVLFANLAFSYLPVSTLGLLVIVQPVVSMCFAAFLLKERLKFIQYTGVLIILFGMWISKI